MIRKIIVSEALIGSLEKYLKVHNLGNRGIEDGTPERQFVGLLGEVVVHKYLFDVYPNLRERQDGFDGGVDMVFKDRKIDVKTMGRNSYVQPHFVNNFYVMQEEYKSDTIIFCSYHKKDKVLEICGWTPKNELQTRGIFYAKGTKRTQDDGRSFLFRQDNYEVENRHLDDIEVLKNIQSV
jgi:hypothetical protein